MRTDHIPCTASAIARAVTSKRMHLFSPDPSFTVVCAVLNQAQEPGGLCRKSLWSISPRLRTYRWWISASHFHRYRVEEASHVRLQTKFTSALIFSIYFLHLMQSDSDSSCTLALLYNFKDVGFAHVRLALSVLL